jgi:integrase
MASVRKHVTKRGQVRYYVRYRDLDGKSREEACRTAAEARARVNELEADKTRGSWIDPKRAARPFSEIAAEWLAANPAKRSSTLARDRNVLDKHVLPELGSRPVGSTHPRQVQALVNDWCEHLAPRSVRRNYDVVRAVFSYAVDADYIARSPCRKIKLPEVHSEDRHIITADELARLGEALGPEYMPIAYLGAVLGLRWGECAGLRVGRIGFLAGTIEVAEQITRGEHGRHFAGPPKSRAGRRVLTAPAWLMEMLATHLARRGITGTERDEYMFRMPEGGPLDYSHWRRRYWQAAIEQAELDGLTFHDLRRAATTALVAEGVDIKTTQARLGHSDPRVTLGLYAQASSDADRDAAARVGDRYRRTLQS